ncbi:hypothetical protein H6G89_09320 [Oscillatoria sp. FACHB-1407]|uniref:hypothetical protein n=1 Tax=Oscillatoria sp. FACHB-1407 TaxID=2692847 RepID=UPI0019C225B8|nr:hypothetical protein [Oscillatoria sp. FACHB-1407]
MGDRIRQSTLVQPLNIAITVIQCLQIVCEHGISAVFALITAFVLNCICIRLDFDTDVSEMLTLLSGESLKPVRASCSRLIHPQAQQRPMKFSMNQRFPDPDSVSET